ncbi:MAG: hypothetical protein LBT54_05275 [Bifidobacteriaceae bacterium]|jgi:predicted MFS family arabinose efflux permease|nr:hypothetical protein [Bifidobacteriaceae bacterium]
MYGALWRALPGPRWFRVFLLCALLLGAVFVCFEYFYPWLSTVLPFNELTVEGSPAPDPSGAGAGVGGR